MFHDLYFDFGMLTQEHIQNIMVLGTVGVTNMIGEGKSIVLPVSPYVWSFDPKRKAWA